LQGGEIAVVAWISFGLVGAGQDNAAFEEGFFIAVGGWPDVTLTHLSSKTGEPHYGPYLRRVCADHPACLQTASLSD
jgi:hypothetical protein